MNHTCKFDVRNSCPINCSCQTLGLERQAFFHVQANESRHIRPMNKQIELKPLLPFLAVAQSAQLPESRPSIQGNKTQSNTSMFVWNTSKDSSVPYSFQHDHEFSSLLGCPLTRRRCRALDQLGTRKVLRQLNKGFKMGFSPNDWVYTPRKCSCTTKYRYIQPAIEC
jgi:hypothetical protein